MGIKIFSGHIVYYLGKWETNENNERVIEKDNRKATNPATHYEVNNIPAMSMEQLVYILSVEIKKSKGYNQPIYISLSESTINEKYEFPSYSERLNIAGGMGDVS